MFSSLQDNLTSATLTLCTDMAYSGSATSLEVYPETSSWSSNVTYTATRMTSIYNGFSSSGPKGTKSISSSLNINRNISVPIVNVLKSSSFIDDFLN